MFDIIGDVHGCCSELIKLLETLGYDVAAAHHPHGRKVVFLGDYIDRGPDSPGALEVAMRFTRAGHLALLGNHETYLSRWLEGREASMGGGFDTTVRQMQERPPEFHREVAAWLAERPAMLVLDGGKLIAVHAAMPAKYLRSDLTRREERKRDQHAVFGPDLAWSDVYDGEPTVVHGHTSGKFPREKAGGKIICVDTGCVYGGALTALRWPEREFVAVRGKPYSDDHPEYCGD